MIIAIKEPVKIFFDVRLYNISVIPFPNYISTSRLNSLGSNVTWDAEFGNMRIL